MLIYLLTITSSNQLMIKRDTPLFIRHFETSHRCDAATLSLTSSPFHYYPLKFLPLSSWDWRGRIKREDPAFQAKERERERGVSQGQKTIELRNELRCCNASKLLLVERWWVFLCIFFIQYSTLLVWCAWKVKSRENVPGNRKKFRRAVKFFFRRSQLC